MQTYKKTFLVHMFAKGEFISISRESCACVAEASRSISSHNTP